MIPPILSELASFTQHLHALLIEGACRHLIKDCMDLTGARWRLKSAEAVLKLRSLRSSGDFEAYWRFHKQQELQRNHLSRYADGLFLDAA